MSCAKYKLRCGPISMIFDEIARNISFKKIVYRCNLTVLIKLLFRYKIEIKKTIRWQNFISKLSISEKIAYKFKLCSTNRFSRNCVQQITIRMFTPLSLFVITPKYKNIKPNFCQFWILLPLSSFLFAVLIDLYLKWSFNYFDQLSSRPGKVGRF